MGTLTGLITRCTNDVGYIEKASNKDLDSKKGNPGTVCSGRAAGEGFLRISDHQGYLPGGGDLGIHPLSDFTADGIGGSGGVLSDSLQQPSAQIPSSHPAGTENPCRFCPGEKAADCHTGLYYRRKHR